MREPPNPPSLNPTARERLSQALRPDFARTAAARRLAAGFLVVLAAYGFATLAMLVPAIAAFDLLTGRTTSGE